MNTKKIASPKFWNVITFGRKSWVIEFNEKYLEILYSKRRVRIEYSSINDFSVISKNLKTTIIIKTENRKFQFFCMPRIEILSFNLIPYIDYLKGVLIKIETDVGILELKIKDILDSDFYISEYEVERIESYFSVFLKNHRESIQVISQLKVDQWVTPLDLRFKSILNRIDSVYKLRSLVEDRNKDFVDNELVIQKEFFDGVESTPLTREQRLASVYFDTRNLLVASAGSGKTSSIVAKSIYALKKGYFKSNEVLMLAFAKDASAELGVRMKNAMSKNDISGSCSIETFHSLGYKIIRDSGVSIRLAYWAGDETKYTALLKKILLRLKLRADLNVKIQILCSLCYSDSEYSIEIKNKLLKLYESENSAMKIRNGVKDLAPDMVTLSGDKVRSFEEVVISNWLYLHSIEYQYEAFKVRNEEKRVSYIPDFYYPKVGVIHEHFGLGEDGRAPIFLGKDYEQRVIEKRDFYHQENVSFFETNSGMFSNGSIFRELENSLKKIGIFPRLKIDFKIQQMLSEGERNLINLMSIAIKHVRNQGLRSKILRSNVHQDDEYIYSNGSELFDEVLNAVSFEYEHILNEEGVLDFEDMINGAAELIEKGRYKSDFRFICVDEFQDISRGRARLIKALMNANSKTYLFGVGDDWQSIFRFAGADLRLFTNMQQFFGKTRELYLTNTFRSNQGIADLASVFVQKNPEQLKKLIKSHDVRVDDVIQVCEYEKDGDQMMLIDRILINLKNKDLGENKITTVLFLGRYNRERPNEEQMKALVMKYPELKLDFKTFHSSKGLQADYVIILGLNSGRNGVPSLRSDHPFVLRYMPDSDPFPFSEERRLFYVALTRAKNKIFLVHKKDEPSIFIGELKQIDSDKVYFAPDMCLFD